MPQMAVSQTQPTYREDEPGESVDRGQGQEPGGDVGFDPSFLNYDKKSLEEIGGMFEDLATSIRTSFDETLKMIKQRETLGGEIYCVLTELQDDEFLEGLAIVNEHLGASHTTFDSYISLSNSTPEFKKFQNIFFDLNEFIISHRRSVFFQVHVRDDQKYMYPYFRIDNDLRNLKFLFRRLCGTLKIAGKYIVNPPPSVRGSAPTDYYPGGGAYDYNRYGGSGLYAPRYPQDFGAGQAEPLRKPLLRDIGDGLGSGER